MFLNSLRLGCAGLPSRLSSSAENEFCRTAAGVWENKVYTATDASHHSPLCFVLMRNKDVGTNTTLNRMFPTGHRQQVKGKGSFKINAVREISLVQYQRIEYRHGPDLAISRNSVAVAEQYTHFPLKIWKSEAVTVHCQLMLSIRISL